MAGFARGGALGRVAAELGLQLDKVGEGQAILLVQVENKPATLQTIELP